MKTLRRVYKYLITNPDDVVQIKMPESAAILSVQMQRGDMCVWALVDPKTRTMSRYFRLAGTGHDIDWVDGMVHRGTFQMHGGELVFHLFEYTKGEPS